MVGRIVEICGAGRYLSCKRGFMEISHGGEVLGRVALDDLEAVVANSPALTYSNQLLLALTARNIAVIFCGDNHLPAALLWPVSGHHWQNARMRAQIATAKPLQKTSLAGAGAGQNPQSRGCFDPLRTARRGVFLIGAQNRFGRSGEYGSTSGQALLAIIIRERISP